MNGFDNFIYMLGALTFAAAIAGGLLSLVEMIERPRKERR